MTRFKGIIWIFYLFSLESESLHQFSLKRTVRPRKAQSSDKSHLLKGRTTRETSSGIDLDSCREITYTCSIELGTPAQAVDVILDTGSSDLWVLKTGYVGKSSSTYQSSSKKFHIAYVDGDAVTGTLATDRLKWGDMIIPSQVFAEVEDNGGFSVSCEEVGILGLALDGLAHSQAPSAFHNLVLLDAIEDPIFSFHIVDDEGGSTFTLGGYDSSQFEGELQWFSITELPLRRLVEEDDHNDKEEEEYYYDDENDEWQDDEFVTGHLHHWEIPLHHASISNDQLGLAHTMLLSDSGASSALIDTGTSRMLVPTHEFAAVLKAIEAECWFTRDDKLDDNEDSFFRADCADTINQYGNADDNDDDEDNAVKPRFFSAFIPCKTDYALTLSFGQGSDAESFTLDTTDLSLPTEACGANQFKDCFGNCHDSDYKDWIGDGSCDDGKHGFSFNCDAFDCDGGDCGEKGSCEMRAPEETCQLGMESSGSDYWTLGDVFLRRIFTAFDYSEGRIGLAYSKKSESSQDQTQSTGREQDEGSKGQKKEVGGVKVEDVSCDETACLSQPKKKEPSRPNPTTNLESVTLQPTTQTEAFPEIQVGLLAFVLGGLIQIAWKWISCYRCLSRAEGFIPLRDQDTQPKWSLETLQARSEVSVICGLALYTALFFWLWALKNVLTRKVPFDFGLVSFLLAAFTHWLGLTSARLHVKIVTLTPPEVERDAIASDLDVVVSRADTFRSMVLWIHLLVAINYGGGFFIYPDVSLKTYCVVFGFLWLGSGVWVNTVSKNWYAELKSDQVRLCGEQLKEEDELEGASAAEKERLTDQNTPQ